MAGLSNRDLVHIMSFTFCGEVGEVVEVDREELTDAPILIYLMITTTYWCILFQRRNIHWRMDYILSVVTTLVAGLRYLHNE
jgi:hypothetical protein